MGGIPRSAIADFIFRFCESLRAVVKHLLTLCSGVVKQLLTLETWVVEHSLALQGGFFKRWLTPSRLVCQEFAHPLELGC